MNTHYRKHQNKTTARAIAARKADDKNTMRVALFATATLSTLLLLLLINP